VRRAGRSPLACSGGWALALAVAFGAFFFAPRACALDAAEALVRAARAKENVPLRAEGQFVIYRRDGEVLTHRFRLTQGRRGAFRREMLAPENLKGHVVISDGHVRWRVLPGGLVAFRSEPLDFDAVVAARVEAARKLPQYYHVELAGKTRVAGREGYILRLSRERQGKRCIRREVVLDTETFVELRNVFYGPDGRELTRSEFIEVQFGVRPSPESFKYAPGPEVLVAPEPRRPSPPLPPGRLPKVRFFRMPGPIAKGWSRPLIAISLYSGVDRPVPVIRWMFTSDCNDRPVFWFLKERDRRAPFFDRFYGLHRVGRTPKKIRDDVVIWHDDEVAYVLAGKIPSEELLRRAKEYVAHPPPLPHTPPPPGRHHRRRGAGHLPEPAEGEPLL